VGVFHEALLSARLGKGKSKQGLVSSTVDAMSGDEPVVWVCGALGCEKLDLDDAGRLPSKDVIGP